MPRTLEVRTYAAHRPSGLAREVAPQNVRAAGDQPDLDGLLAGVREGGVARSEVHGRDAERGKARHVGPAVLRHRPFADRVDEVRSSGRCQPGKRTRCGVDERDVVRRKNPTHVIERLLLRPVRGEPEVDDDRARVRNDVARDAAGDGYRVEPLAVEASVDVDL